MRVIDMGPLLLFSFISFLLDHNELKSQLSKISMYPEYVEIINPISLIYLWSFIFRKLSLQRISDLRVWRVDAEYDSMFIVVVLVKLIHTYLVIYKDYLSISLTLKTNTAQEPLCYLVSFHWETYGHVFGLSCCFLLEGQFCHGLPYRENLKWPVHQGEGDNIERFVVLDANRVCDLASCVFLLVHILLGVLCCWSLISWTWGIAGDRGHA